MEIIFQSIEGLHTACPAHQGDWYFTGNYPTPGVIGWRIGRLSTLSNRATIERINKFELLERAFDIDGIGAVARMVSLVRGCGKMSR